MGIKKTTFGRHYTFDYVKKTHMCTNANIDFHIKAPKNCYIIKGTMKRFGKDALKYMYVEQLNSCDACIITTSCVHSYGHFNCTMRLISYDTCVCEVRFLSEHRRDDTKPYIEIIFGEHWNYSATTRQHVYKFLRKFAITHLCVSDYAKYDLKLGSGKYTFASYVVENDLHNKYIIRFSDANAITDFRLNAARHIVEREYTHVL